LWTVLDDIKGMERAQKECAGRGQAIPEGVMVKLRGRRQPEPRESVRKSERRTLWGKNREHRERKVRGS